MSDFKEQQELIKMWKEKYYQTKKEINKQKEVLDKIKEYIKERTEFGEYDHAYPGILNQDEVRHINRLLEEIE